MLKIFDVFMYLEVQKRRYVFGRRKEKVGNGREQVRKYFFSWCFGLRKSQTMAIVIHQKWFIAFHFSFLYLLNFKRTNFDDRVVSASAVRSLHLPYTFWSVANLLVCLTYLQRVWTFYSFSSVDGSQFQCCLLLM